MDNKSKELKYLDIAIKILLKFESADDYIKYKDLIEDEDKKDIDHVLNILIKENIINSARGNKGGYFLTETVMRFTVKEIYLLLKDKNICAGKSMSFNKIHNIFKEEYMKYENNLEKRLGEIKLKDLK